MAEKKDFSILIVDDEEIVRQTVQKILLEEGYCVLVAADGNAAINVAAANDIDLALLDIKLPDMNGVEVLKRIKAIKPALKAIMMTAYEVEELVGVAVCLGARLCLNKPFDINKLISMVKKIKEEDD